MTAYQRLTWVFVAVIAAGCVAGIIVPAGPGWDFANFYDAGRRVAARDTAHLYEPDSPIAGSTPQGKTGFYGTPISALFYAPLAGLSAETALVLFKIQNVIALWLGFLILFRFYRTLASRDDADQARFATWFAFLCLIYQPFWTIFRVGGQTTPTALLLIVAGLVLHTSGRLWGSAIAIVLAVLIKPGLAYALIFLVCVAGLGFLWRLLVVLALTGLVSLATLGWPVHAAFLKLMQQSTQFTWAWYFNSALYVPIDNLRVYATSTGRDFGFALAVATNALKIAVVLTLATLAWRSRQSHMAAAARRHFDYTLAVLFFLLWSPTIWEHYLELLFPFLIYVVASRERLSREATVIVGVIFALSLFQNLILINWVRDHVTFESLPALAGVALIKSGPLLLTLVFLWRHGRALVQSHSTDDWDQRASTVAARNA